MTPEEYSELMVAAATWRTSKALHERCCGEALIEWLSRHQPVTTAPSVPVSELQELLDGPDLQGGVWNAIRRLIEKRTPRPELPPNTEKPGTYLWALEEHRRGREVRCGWRKIADGSKRTVVGPDRDWNDVAFDHADFIATDWESVP